MKYAISFVFLAALAAPCPMPAEDSATPSPAYPDADSETVPTELFVVPEGLEVTLWATSPDLYNPTNMDIDKDGRIWVAEGVRYRRHWERQPEGDRIVVLEDTDRDGKADSSHTFVQEELLIAPLGVSVIDNKIVVAQPPHLLVYTDVDRDLRFNPDVDKREILLTGFQGQNHDHSLHSLTVGPDGKWYFNFGNCGAKFTDKSGQTFTVFGAYRPKVIGPFEFPHNAGELAGLPSDDGHVYVGGATVRMNPDGTNAEIIGHNYRNSYEQAVTSFGDVFQNDNDDPPACRVSWVMEYANFGFSSNDGQRSWRADKRPGQTTQIAEWRQEDPGMTPAGDVYGGGSPTGVVYYENGALGDEWIGTFLACEAGRNVIFSYQPELEGASFQLDRSDFMTSNTTGKFAGSDFIGGSSTANREAHTLFRPSDVAIGPDGALYVTDWYDPRVGGHQDLDETCSGAIYRIAPKGFKSVIPQFDPDTIEGLITALKSPAPNVRAIGFEGLKAKGRPAMEAIAALLDDPNPYIQSRAIFLLYQMGISGPRMAGYPADQPTTQRKIAAYRAMRRAGLDFSASALRLANDPDPAVRREVALSMRNETIETSKEILVAIASGYDGHDRSYLEAFGTGATGKEDEIFQAVKGTIGSEDFRTWTEAFAGIAWRLQPASSIDDFLSRAKLEGLPMEQRRLAMDSIAFIPTKSASEAMLTLAQLDTPLKADATWWVMNRANNEWKDFDLRSELKARGIYDPDKVEIQEVATPEPDPAMETLKIADALALEGDVERGKIAVSRCVMCHEVGGMGVQFGPALDGWGKTQTAEVIARSIIDPNADIAHGFDGMEIKLKDGRLLNGLVIQDGDPVIMVSMGGLTQMIPKNQIKGKWKAKRSLMLTGAQLGLTPQDVADLIAYLKAN